MHSELASGGGGGVARRCRDKEACSNK